MEKKPNILLMRIDNRLLHGQVGGTWVNALGANLIIVANDDVALDELQQEVMKMTAANFGNSIRFFSIQKTIDVIWKAAPAQKIFIVVKNPEDARRLAEGNVPVGKVNIGNMHAAEGKRKITKDIYMDDRDIEDLKKLQETGVEVFIQELPSKPKTLFRG